MARLTRVGQGAAADGDAGLLDALVLAIQRQVELELVHQQPVGLNQAASK